jgi:hypothetical protein
VWIGTDLGWADAAAATAYDVYFGTSATPPFVGSVTASAYDLPSLSISTEYYWQIVAKNACGETPGPVWRFATAATANHPPENLSVWPNQGGRPAGRRVNFTTTYRDFDGWRDLKQVSFIVGRTRAQANNCLLMYDLRRNELYMRSNDGSRWIGGRAPGSASAIRNRQCTLNCLRTTVTTSGRIARVKWSLLFRSSYRGNKDLAMRSTDRSGGAAPWQKKGTWRVR